MTGDDLRVDVREFAARVFEKELPLEGVDRSEHIYEQDSEPQEKLRSVIAKKDMPVRDKEFQLTQQPESQREKKCNRDDERVGNHERFPKSSQNRS